LGNILVKIEGFLKLIQGYYMVIVRQRKLVGNIGSKRIFLLKENKLYQIEKVEYV